MANINVYDVKTINYQNVRELVASEEDSSNKEIYILSDGSVAILQWLDRSRNNITHLNVELSNGGSRRWGAKAVRDSDWIMKIHDELLRHVPNQHRGFIED